MFTRSLGIAVSLVALAACQPTTGPTGTPAVLGKPPAAVASGRAKPFDHLARYATPARCQPLPVTAMRQGKLRGKKSGCAILGPNYRIIVGLTETTAPFWEVFSASDPEGFEKMVRANPRPVLADALESEEKLALSLGDVGYSFRNKRMTVLPGNGGLQGADACVRFSFTFTGGPSAFSDGKTSGLRCAALDRKAGTVDEVMVEIMCFHPRGRALPGECARVERQVLGSLRITGS